MVGQDGSIFKGRPNGKVFANFAPQQKCGCHTGKTDVGGDTVYTCKNGNHAWLILPNRT